ncbi:Lactoylglutathione lyase [Magnetospirillum sp. LM-5]|uniref:VOC family protein n=1 Tax=Magnetospirillum sp. LM-5 TaxID=2681466 RepID=UPI00138480D4|nr:VOC family protein [Magnetospirillum sp. LM-5]CAA7611576.1 Lactoylglutathione lyase [Magnetospirillum sp. LM-5]
MTLLDHVNLVVTDPVASRDFYGRLLGLVPVMDRWLEGEWFDRLTGIDGARARCIILDAPDGGCRIELLAFTAPEGTTAADLSNHAATGLRHVAIRVDDLDACLARLEAQPPAIEVPRAIVPVGKRMAYVPDPDGIIIELAEYGGTPSVTFGGC